MKIIQEMHFDCVIVVDFIFRMYALMCWSILCQTLEKCNRYEVVFSTHQTMMR